jgi:RNA polymerase sigma factor (sigma-70 family)
VEASTLTHAQRRGLFARRSPLLRLQGDESLVALTRNGHQHAFETLVQRYQSRLLGFCRQMLGCTEDAEDVLQEVFVAAYNAMVADDRPIAVRPWLYRIARNRCLNLLRKPTADGQDTMDTHPHMNGVTTLERVQNREEFRNLLSDVGNLPETQRSALLLREIDAMSYEEIAQAMDTTVPGVKSLLVRARIALAESSQARQLTCDEVRVQLAEATEGLAKVDGAVRRHIKACDGCHDFRAQLRSDSKVLAALFPAAPLLLLKGLIIGKISGIFGGGGGGAAAGAGGGGAAAGAGAGAGAAGAGAAGAAAAGGTAATATGAGAGAAIGGAAAAGGAAAGGAGAAAATGAAAAIGTKAAAGLATAAILTAGAVEVDHATHHPTPKASQAAKHKPADRGKPAVIPPTPPPTTAAAATTPPTTAAATTPPAQTVTVAPVPEDPSATTETGGVAPIPGKCAARTPATTIRTCDQHKRKHGAQANSDGQQKTAPTTGPVTTGLDPACDANGDGIADPGTSTTCTGPASSTSLGTADSQPATLLANAKKKAKKKAQSAKRRRARAR